jgi:thiamine biosynthesis lipoprotein
VIVFGCILGMVAARATEVITLSGRAMGTTWSVKFIQGANPIAPAEVQREVSNELERLEQIFSTYRAQSELSRFNAVRHTDWIPVAADMARVAEESRCISAFTGGAFDVTVHPLVQLWGFGARRRTGSVPAAGEINAARARVDWRALEVRLSPPALRKARPAITADLSSIVKGFAADRVGEILIRLGVPDHLVLVGGDVKAGGRGPEGTGWRTAIEHPSHERRSPAAVFALTGRALSTSGDYRNFFSADGRRYGHIIDPRTGVPASGELASVSVVHDSCATSSALATGLFVLGVD